MVVIKPVSIFPMAQIRVSIQRIFGNGWTTLGSAQDSRFISIPHNSNISKGYMFGTTSVKGQPITADYARTRMQWEPITEVTQIKGDSETHAKFSPEDEFADFETYEHYIQTSREQN